MEYLPLMSAGHSMGTQDLLSISGIVAFLTLIVMEIVLGIDNIVFVAILVGKVPREKQKFVRTVGMSLALFLRLGLLLGIKWVMGLTATFIGLPEFMRPDSWAGENPVKTGLTGKDLILLAGGIFLIYKASKEVFEKLECDSDEEEGESGGTFSLPGVIVQLIVLDLVFSLDSVITAVGMANRIEIMIAAMVIAVGVMMVAAGSVSDFVQRHPSVKILALSFLNLIGVMLVLEGFGEHVNKGYIYSAMAFSLLVEVLNMRYRKKQKPLRLHGSGKYPAIKELE